MIVQSLSISPNSVSRLLTVEYNDFNEDFKSINILDSQGRLLVMDQVVLPI